MNQIFKTGSDDLNFDKSDSLSKRFLNQSLYTFLDNIPEILCEWWTSSGKDLHTFLEDENLSQFTSDKTFINILLGKHYFSEHFLILLSSKIVPKVTLERLYWLNRNFAKAHPEATELKTDKSQILDFLKKKRTQKKEEQRNLTKERQKKYYDKNSTEVKRKSNERYHKYSDEINKRRRELYRENLDENRKKARKRRREHRDEINKRRLELYHENLAESRSKARKRLREHRDEINKRRRERYHKNLDENREKNRKRRREHRDEINKRRQELYRENLEKGRAQNRALSRTFRIKKRFRTKTGKMIFPLLDALIQSKLQR